MILKNTLTPIKKDDSHDQNTGLKPRDQTISVLRPYVNFLNSMIDN